MPPRVAKTRPTSNRGVISADLNELYQIAKRWQIEAWEDPPSHYPYISLIEDLVFHEEFRFPDYIAFEKDGPFFFRLRAWIGNLTSEKKQQALLQLLDHLMFFDSSQMRALYRDAFRRILIPWLCQKQMTILDHLAADIDQQIHGLLSNCALFCITESFQFDLFLKTNDLLGLSKPRILTEDPDFARQLVSTYKQKQIIVFEDFVGTGNQASRILEIVKTVAHKSQIIFVPLLILESGLTKLGSLASPKFTIEPVLTIPASACLTSRSHPKEPKEFSLIRGLVRDTAEIVTAPFGKHDDIPKSAFGYEDSGALVVTCHNSPNNTLPLIHHEAPLWRALFRRLHHRPTKRTGKNARKSFPKRKS